MAIEENIKEGLNRLRDILANMLDTNSLSLANFVGCVVGFLDVFVIRLWRLLLAASLSFEIEMI